MKVKRIGDWTLEDRIAAGGPPVVVMFLNSDGGKFEAVRAEFRRIAEEHPDANFYELDLAENPSAAVKYSVVGQPMVQVFVDGSLVAGHTGPWLAATIIRAIGPCHREGGGP